MFPSTAAAAAVGPCLTAGRPFADLQADPDDPSSRPNRRRRGRARTVASRCCAGGTPSAPSLSCGAARTPFPDQQVALLETFAAQAVIAIENVRLFQELELRNRDLTEALERETATGGILRAIATSPTDPGQVFEAILESALRLCGATIGSVNLTDGRLMSVAAIRGPAGLLEAVKSAFPRRLTEPGLATRAVREGVTVHVADVREDPSSLREVDQLSGIRADLHVPMWREGRCIGSIIVHRDAPGLFSEAQVALVHTLADQAAIAVENVRLFRELEARNRDLTEALQQQTATAEILRVISSSPTDLQPVMETVVESAARLCGAADATILRMDGDVLRLVAHHGPAPTTRSIGERIPVTRTTMYGRALVDRQTIHIKDFAEAVETEFPEHRERQRLTGIRTFLATPLLREGVPIGVIAIRRTEVRPFSDTQIALLKSFADQAVIAIENVRLFQELEARNRELTESLEQQTATAEILRVIASSPTDLQPVMEAVAENAARVCGATDSSIFRLEGDHLSMVALYGPLRRSLAIGDVVPVSRDTLGGRVVLDRRTIHLEDILAAEAEFPVTVARLRRTGSNVRTSVSTPLLREGTPLGVIIITRGPEVQPFSAKQIALLETFANQAVIAIENVRLFKELQARNAELAESLEQQTATSEILRVISSSPTDLQPVMDVVAESAARFCGATDASIWRLEGEVLRRAAAHGLLPASTSIGGTIAVTLRDVAGRSVLDRETIHIEDLSAPSEAEFPETQERLRHLDVPTRTILATPLLREDVPIGVIVMRRGEVLPFTEKQIELAKTFAHQAVIAIENVRLFTELEARNAELTESLEQQTATGEILRVISSSPTDVQPVFDAIVRSALSLCEAVNGSVFRFDGRLIHLVAHRGSTPETMDVVLRIFPHAPGRGSAVGRAILTRVVQVDIAEGPGIRAPETARSRRASALSSPCPCCARAAPIGAIIVIREGGGPFTDRQIALLQTFADQAVIAIENVRLFKELEARTQDLTRSVGELRALGDVGRALSSTLDLDTVLQTIVTRASQLAGTDACSLFEYDEVAEVFRLRASSYRDPGEAETLDAIGRATPIPKGQGVVSRAAASRQPVQVSDIAVEGSYESPIRGPLMRAGYRAILTVPLFLEERVIGALGVSRKTPGEFAPEIVRAPHDVCHPVGACHPERAPVPGDRGQEPAARSGQPPQVRVPRQHVPRAPDALERDPRLLGGPGRADVRGGQREAGRVPPGHPVLGPASPLPDQRHPRPRQGGGRAARAGARSVPSAHRPGQCPDPGPGAGDPARDHAHPDRGRAVGDIVADERKVKQILLNLLSNAVKFTPEGGRVGLTATAGRRRRHHRCQRHGGRDRARGPGGHLRGVPPGRARRHPQAGGHGARADARQEVRGAARRANLGREPGGSGVDVQLHAARSAGRKGRERSGRRRAATAMTCPRCHAENRDGLRFCEDCGSRLTLTCAQCGGELAPGKRFCGSCGSLAEGQSPARTPGPESHTPKHLVEKILTSKAALEGERKQVTVLFADLKGSMELLADRDPEEARKLLDPVLERMMEAVHRYEGTVNQVMGDGIMALFGAPLAHEDHAVRACYAALDMQAAMRRYAEEVRHAHGIEVQIRVGLNSGEVVVRAIGSDLRMDYTAVGQTTHLAARMEQLATPGTIRLTADTLRLAEGYIEVKPLGPVPVKGLEAPINVYEMFGAGPRRSRLLAAAARGLTRFVGRDAELEQLRQALGRAAAGHGQLVAIVGEPGVGKSRLVWEVTHSHRTHGWLILQAGSVSYGKATPYSPRDRSPQGLPPGRRPRRAPRHPGEGHRQAPRARPRPRAGAASVPRAPRRAGGGPPLGHSRPA